MAAPKNLAELSALERQIKAVAAKVTPAVVGVQIGISRGSGVIVSEDGLVLTAGHVAGKPHLPVTFLFHDGTKAQGTTLGIFASADAALLKITDPGKYPCVERGRSAALQLGQWCLALGHPLGYKPGRPPVVRVGRILNLLPMMIQTDCPLVGGDSGGPLFDLAGRVIAVHSRISSSPEANFHVAIDVFRDAWDRLLQGEAWNAELPSRESPEVKDAFRGLVADASQCVVRVRCNNEDVALGTIVGPDGWILTKASQLQGKITCRFRDGYQREARIVGLSKVVDLAMLKVEARRLPVISWKTEPLEVGQWVATPGLSGEPLALGIVSVRPQKIPPVKGALGVRLYEETAGPPLVEEVLSATPAEEAGIKPQDVITHFEGQSIENIGQLRRLLRRHRPGEKVSVTLKRGNETLRLELQLARILTPAAQQQELMNNLGVGVNRRADDFPIVSQHDTVLPPVDCGGPLVDLSGKVVGVNIARAGRTETYALPADALFEVMYELMSGRLDPQVLAEKDAAEKKAREERLAAAEKAEAEKIAVGQERQIPPGPPPVEHPPAPQNPPPASTNP